MTAPPDCAAAADMHSTGALPLYACIRLPQPEAAAALARDFSPRVQRYGDACVVLDICGLERLLGDAQAIGREIARLADLPAAGRVAVAPTQVGAMLLSAAYAGLTVVNIDIASALAPVPLAVLHHVHAEREAHAFARSASRKTRSASRASRSSSASRLDLSATLERWGLTTIGDYAALPAVALSARLGHAGLALQQLARGVDVGPLVPDPDVPRFLERIELEWPIDTLEPLAFVLARLLDPLAAALERADRAAAAVHLHLRLVDRTVHVRQLQLPAAIRDPKVLRTLLVLDLESHPPAAAIDVVTIEVDPAPARVLQYSLLERARPSVETLATLTARLAALVGETRSGEAVLLDSYEPDAFVMRRYAPADEPSHATPVASSHATHVASAFRRKNEASAQSFRLQAEATEPVPIDPAPTDPAPNALVSPVALRRFRPPIAIRVTVTHGRPAHVFVDRRGMPGGAVEQCAGPWRSSGAWWTDHRAGAPAPRVWNRDEWDVALSDGSVCRLFQARQTSRWFLDGVVD
jgi:protein ImuB